MGRTCESARANVGVEQINQGVETAGQYFGQYLRALYNMKPLTKLKFNMATHAAGKFKYVVLRNTALIF